MVGQSLRVDRVRALRRGVPAVRHRPRRLPAGPRARDRCRSWSLLRTHGDGRDRRHPGRPTGAGGRPIRLPGARHRPEPRPGGSDLVLRRSDLARGPSARAHRVRRPDRRRRPAGAPGRPERGDDRGTGGGSPGGRRRRARLGPVHRIRHRARPGDHHRGAADADGAAAAGRGQLGPGAPDPSGLPRTGGVERARPLQRHRRVAAGRRRRRPRRAADPPARPAGGQLSAHPTGRGGHDHPGHRLREPCRCGDRGSGRARRAVLRRPDGQPPGQERVARRVRPS